RLRDRRRVEHDQIEALAGTSCLSEPLQYVGTHEPVAIQVDSVQLEIALRPIEIGIGQIYADRVRRVACCGVYREAARVAEQIQKPFALGLLLNQRARVAMVEEQ